MSRAFEREVMKRNQATGVLDGNSRPGAAKVYTLADVSALMERVQFLKARLEMIRTVSRQTWRTAEDRLGTCEHEAEHCLGITREW